MKIVFIIVLSILYIDLFAGGCCMEMDTTAVAAASPTGISPATTASFHCERVMSPAAAPALLIHSCSEVKDTRDSCVVRDTVAPLTAIPYHQILMWEGDNCYNSGDDRNAIDYYSWVVIHALETNTVKEIPHVVTRLYALCIKHGRPDAATLLAARIRL